MKKILLFSCIAAGILAIAIVPANAFWFAMPEYITAIISAVIVCLLVVFFIKGKGKALSKSYLCMFAVISIVAAIFGSFCNPYWNSVTFRDYQPSQPYDKELSFAQAKSDLDYAMFYLKKDHPAFLGSMPEGIQAAYEESLSALNTGTITVNSLRQAIQNVYSKLGDAHSSCWWNGTSLYLKDTAERNANGDILVAINGHSPKDLLQARRNLYSYELEAWGLYMLEQDLFTLHGLDYLGLDAGAGVEYTYEDANGNKKTFTRYIDGFITAQEYNEYAGSEEQPFVSYEIDTDKSLAVLTLKNCTYNEEYRDCVREMFTEVKAKGIKNVAVDLRDNGGGSSIVANEFIRYLDVETFRTESDIWRLGMISLNTGDGAMKNEKYADALFTGNVYALTSTGSFSSAMLFAQYIKDNGLGLIIGEAPGTAATHYGEIATFTLPHSGLYLSLPTKQFFRADKENPDTIISPDILCDAGDAMDVLYSMID